MEYETEILGEVLAPDRIKKLDRIGSLEYVLKTIGGKDLYIPSEIDDRHPQIPPGIYNAVPAFGTMIFSEFPRVSDALLDLESPEYKEVLSHTDWFLKPETKAKFEEADFLYKTALLLYGEPGTGKTSLVSRVNDRIVEQGGIVVYCSRGEYIKEILSLAPKDMLLTIVLEELDTFHDVHLLSALDGECQRNNVIYIATTNYREKISPRLLRPSRIGKKVEVHYPNEAARQQYFTLKMGGNQVVAKKFARLTEGLSVDDLKHVVIMAKIQDMSAEEAAKAVRSERQR